MTHDSLRAYASQLQMGWKTLITKYDKSILQYDPQDYYDAVKDAMADGYDAVKIDPCFAGLSKEVLCHRIPQARRQPQGRLSRGTAEDCR